MHAVAKMFYAFLISIKNTCIDKFESLFSTGTKLEKKYVFTQLNILNQF